MRRQVTSTFAAQAGARRRLIRAARWRVAPSAPQKRSRCSIFTVEWQGLVQRASSKACTTVTGIRPRAGTAMFAEAAQARISAFRDGPDEGNVVRVRC